MIEPVPPIIAKLFHPFEINDFVDGYWQRRELLIQRDNPSFYSEIISVADIDRVIAEVAIPKDNIDMGQNAVGIPRESYSGDKFINPQKVLDFHRAGQTIIFRGAHNWFPNLKRLCNELSKYFHCRVQTNLYLTPENTQSSYPHWDAHDIFVLQIAGSKVWRTHESRLAKPLPRYEFSPDRYEIGPENGKLYFSAGDFAYIPRGLIHNPIAEKYSIHVAVGVIVTTWLDLIEKIVANSGDASVMLREALPTNIGKDDFDVKAIRDHFEKISQYAIDPSHLKIALLELTQRLEHSRASSTRNQLSHYVYPPRLSSNTLVEIRPDLVPSLALCNDKINLVNSGSTIEFPSDFEEELRTLLQRRVLEVHEISGRSLQHAIAIAEVLLENGIIAVKVCAD